MKPALQSTDTFYFKRKDHLDTSIQSVVPMSQNVEIALAKNYYWRKNNLTVSFLDGDPVVERKIINIVKKWEDVCSIKFLFGAYADADITISFLYRGSWSYIGSYSTQVRPSMNFGCLIKQHQIRNTTE